MKKLSRKQLHELYGVEVGKDILAFGRSISEITEVGGKRINKRTTDAELQKMRDEFCRQHYGPRTIEPDVIEKNLF